MYRNAPIWTAFQTYYQNRPYRNPEHPFFTVTQSPGDWELQINCEVVNGHRPTRWPYNANTDSPSYSNPPIQFLIGDTVRLIGSTYWHWVSRSTPVVGFDIDAIGGHSTGLSPEQIAKIDASLPEWISSYRSKSGSGRHLFVQFETPPQSLTHDVHAAIARALAPLLCQALQQPDAVDVCGGVLWGDGPASKFPADAFATVHRATRMLRGEDELPAGWRDLAPAPKRLVSMRVPEGMHTVIDREPIELSEHQRETLNTLCERGAEWDAERGLCRTHTGYLTGLDRFKLFRTLSPCSDLNQANCFLVPSETNDGWTVFRFSRGVREHQSWDCQGEQDEYTRVTFDAATPTLHQHHMVIDGVRCVTGSYIHTPETIQQFLASVNEPCDLPPAFEDRNINVTGTQIWVSTRVDDEGYPGWELVKATKKMQERWVWQMGRNAQRCEEAELGLLDYWSRWCRDRAPEGIKSKSGVYQYRGASGWHGTTRELLTDTVKTRTNIIPNRAFHHLHHNSWQEVRFPFRPRILTGRRDNSLAPRFAFDPAPKGTEPDHPHWTLIFDHVGSELTSLLQGHWLNDYDITSGGDYLISWVAAKVHNPLAHLPYLFFFGPQNSGKSTVIESLEWLVPGGVVNGGKALSPQSNFNGELDGAVFVKCEEIDLNHPQTYARMKEWVTAHRLQIHPKGKTPIEVPNYLSFWHCANSRDFCPAFAGDTRVLTLEVPLPAREIPRGDLDARLREEAPHFIRTLLDRKLPPETQRLALPLFETDSKCELMMGQLTDPQAWIMSHINHSDDSAFFVNDAYDAFLSEYPHYTSTLRLENFGSLLAELGYMSARRKRREGDPNPQTCRFGILEGK